MAASFGFNWRASAIVLAVVIASLLTWLQLRNRDRSDRPLDPVEALQSTIPAASTSAEPAPHAEPIQEPSLAPVPDRPTSVPPITTQAVSSLRLRVVDPDGAAVPGARIVIRLVGPPGTKSKVIRGSADVWGVFTGSEIVRDDCRSITATVSLDDGKARRVHEFAATDPLPKVWDLGDLSTAEPRLITLMVYDHTGSPIAHAAVTWPEAKSPPKLTDSSGHAELALAPEIMNLDIQAKEFTSKRVKLGGASKATRVLEVVLEKVTELTLRVSPDSRTELAGEIFVSFARADSSRTAHRESCEGSLARDDQGKSKSGEYVWSDLPPNVELRAELKSLGKVIGSLDIAPLSSGEHRVEELRIDARSEPMTLIVLGPNGEPVDGARIELKPRSEPVGRFTLRTNAAGEALGRIYRPVVLDIAVHAEGFAQKSLHDVAIPYEPLQLRLERERIVVVEVVGPDGSPRSESLGTVLVCVDGNFGVGGESLGANRWRFKGLPRGEIVILLGSGISLVHDTAVPTARLVAGWRGHLSAELEVDESDPLARWAVSARSVRHPTLEFRAINNLLNGPRAGVVFAGLPPGSYELCIERQANDELLSWQPWGRPVTVQVGTEPVEVKIGP